MLGYTTKGVIRLISYVYLENFKSFAKILFNLQGSHKKPKSCAFIYGENGTGKSNLISSIIFLQKTLETFVNQSTLEKMLKQQPETMDVLNSDSKDDDIHKFLKKIFQQRFQTLSATIAEYKKIASSEPMVLEFGFRIQGFDGVYHLEFSNQEIILEQLRYRLQERTGYLFSMEKGDEFTLSLSPQIFHDTAYRKELAHLCEQYWGKHTFLSILQNEQQNKNEEYFNRRVHSHLLLVLSWFQHLAVWHKDGQSETAHFNTPLHLVGRLSRGTGTEKDRSELDVWENVLSMIFTQLYPDVKKAYYVYEPNEEGFFYQLYFKKLIDGQLLDVPFSLESTGTQRLLTILPLLLLCILGDVVVIDEIDSGIHDLLVTKLIENILDAAKGQLIVTTHNTLLLDELPPQNIYIFRIDSAGHKSLECVSNYIRRTQRSNSIRRKYLRGDYAGVPEIGFLDFDDIGKQLQEAYASCPKES